MLFKKITTSKCIAVGTIIIGAEILYPNIAVDLSIVLPSSRIHGRNLGRDGKNS
jgi:hypothetical protein